MRQPYFYRLWRLAFALMLLGIVGCGSKHSATVPVTGTVTLDGQPLAGVGVLFSPQSTGRPAHGMTDASGNFSLQTYDVPGDGAIPGTYLVAIIPPGKTPPGGKKIKIPAKYMIPENSAIVRSVDDPMEPVTIALLSE